MPTVGFLSAKCTFLYTSHLSILSNDLAVRNGNRVGGGGECKQIYLY